MKWGLYSIYSLGTVGPTLSLRFTRERERERVEAKIRKAGTLITYHLELAFGRMAQETWRPT